MTETIVIPITIDNLPTGNLWESDGSCWEAVIEPREERGWRWRPKNWKALAKEGPEGEMTDHFPLLGNVILNEGK